MNKTQIIEETARRMGLSQAETGRLLEATLQVMSDALLRGDDITIQSFGSFRVVKREQHRFYNPVRKMRMIAPPKLVISFKTSRQLHEAVNAK